MVKKMEHMGEKNSNYLVRKIDSYLMGIYRELPFTYLGMLRRSFSEMARDRKKIRVLDLGCGDGTATENLKLARNFEVVGVDIFPPYLELAKKKGIYKRLIKADVEKFKPVRNYDIVIALHILEHLEKKAGERFLKKIEGIANKKVIVVVPIGFLPQSEYDNNPHQLHKSSWSASEMINRGYEVKAQGLKILWGNENIVPKYGVFSYLLFLISFLLTPIMRLNPELGTYLICVKDIERW